MGKRGRKAEAESIAILKSETEEESEGKEIDTRSHRREHVEMAKSKGVCHVENKNKYDRGPVEWCTRLATKLVSE